MRAFSWIRRITAFIAVFVLAMTVALPLVLAADGNIELSVPIGGTRSVTGLPDYIARAYRYGISIVVVIATIMVVYGGFLYLISPVAGTISKGKEIIKDALAGMVIALGAFLILNTVNPALVQLKMPTLPKISRVEYQAPIQATTGTIAIDDEVLNLNWRMCTTDHDCVSLLQNPNAKCLRYDFGNPSGRPEDRNVYSVEQDSGFSFSDFACGVLDRFNPLHIFSDDDPCGTPQTKTRTLQLLSGRDSSPPTRYGYCTVGAKGDSCSCLGDGCKVSRGRYESEISHETGRSNARNGFLQGMVESTNNAGRPSEFRCQSGFTCSFIPHDRSFHNSLRIQNVPVRGETVGAWICLNPPTRDLAELGSRIPTERTCENNAACGPGQQCIATSRDPLRGVCSGGETGDRCRCGGDGCNLSTYSVSGAASEIMLFASCKNSTDVCGFFGREGDADIWRCVPSRAQALSGCEQLCDQGAQCQISGPFVTPATRRNNEACKSECQRTGQPTALCRPS